MKVSYDKRADALYISFNDQAINETDEDKSGNILIDYSKEGNIAGIEILNASNKVLSPSKVDFELL